MRSRIWFATGTVLLILGVVVLVGYNLHVFGIMETGVAGDLSLWPYIIGGYAAAVALWSKT